MFVEVPAPPWITSTTNCSLQRAAADVRAGLCDGGRVGVGEPPEITVGRGRGLLDGGEGGDQLRVVADRDPADREVAQRPGRVHAVVGVVGHRELAEQVVFHAVTGLFPSRSYLAHA